MCYKCYTIHDKFEHDVNSNIECQLCGFYLNQIAETCWKATSVWRSYYPSVKMLSASVFLTSRLACGWLPLPCLTSNAFIRILTPCKKFWKYKAMFFLQIHHWTLFVDVTINVSLKIRKNLKVSMLCHFSVLQKFYSGKKNLLLPSTPYSFDKTYRLVCRILLYVLYFPIFSEQ